MKVKEESEKVGLKLNIQKTKIMASGAITSWEIDGETVETVADFIFLGSKITTGGDCSHEIKRRLLLGRKVMTNLDSILKSRHYFANNGPSSQGHGSSFGHVWVWELDYKESWALKNWCFWTRVLEKTLENPLDCKEIQPVHPKGDQSWVFIGRTDAEAETPILWPPDAKSWLIGKDPVSGKDWKQEEKGMTQDEIIGWHHWLNGHGFRWWTGRPGVLWFMGSQRIGHNWATELNWTESMRLTSCSSQSLSQPRLVFLDLSGLTFPLNHSINVKCLPFGRCCYKIFHPNLLYPHLCDLSNSLNLSMVQCPHL